MPPPACVVSPDSRVSELIAERALAAVFQPIVDIDTGRILGHEGLIRGPAGTPFEHPAELFAQASREGVSIALEHAAAAACVEAFAALECDGKLFINFSALAIQHLAERYDDVLALLARARLPADRIVIELTEQSVITEPGRFTPAITSLRSAGMQFALDDYGTANASMNLWVRLHPDVVKIDRFFIHEIASDPLKFEAVRAMQHFANASGAKLIAEGIENEADLIVVRDMGIGCGQGFFLGRPNTQPTSRVAQRALDAMAAQHIAVFPGATRSPLAAPAGGAGTVAARMLVRAPALPAQATNNDVLDLFNRMPGLHAVAVVECDQPVGLIARRSFMDRYALPYHREVFGRKPCLHFANGSPLVVEGSTPVEQVAKFLMSGDQRYLADGFVIAEHGRYVGLGTGEQLVRAVTEVRIEAARYANPLTFLPGNIPVSAHMARLVDNDALFHACYVDLNHFKPFNDQYGYWQGDEVLKFTAAVLADVCDPTRDFLGHVGGDDFLVLFQSTDWDARVKRAIDTFGEGVQRFYASADRLAGGIRGEDRHGNPAFFGFVTMSVGCVRVPAAPIRTRRYGSDEIASVAALAKRRAKRDASGCFVIGIDEGSAWLRASDEADTAPASAG